jgi:hypothetical protein
MKDKVKHIPERGCHNCRLHYVNHKKCNSDSPCKQGGEWRPIIEVEAQPSSRTKKINDLRGMYNGKTDFYDLTADDLKPLEPAIEQEERSSILNCTSCGKPHLLSDNDAGTAREMEKKCITCFKKEEKQPESAEEILKKHYPIDIAITDDTLDDIIKAMEDYHNQFASQQKEVSDEEIEKEFPTNLNAIKKKEGFDKMSYEGEQSLRLLARHNESKQEGAKWYRDLISKRNG